MGSLHLERITESSFDSLVDHCDEPIFLCFEAVWCFPCKMLAPILEALATEYKGLVLVGSVDTESNSNLAHRFSVSALPTVLIFHRGKLIKTCQGSRSRREYARFLDSLLNEGNDGLRLSNGPFIANSPLNY